MKTASENTRITAVWGVLVAITLVTWLLGHTRSGGHLGPSLPITIAVLTMTTIKVRFVIRHFMEVRSAPGMLRLGTDIWLVALWAAVLGVYVY